MSVETRPERISKLLALRNRVDAEIAAIEAEIRDEIEATARAKESARQANVRLRNRPIARCGTETGYSRHRRVLKEPACDACKLAHRVYESERLARKAGRSVDDTRVDLRERAIMGGDKDGPAGALTPGIRASTSTTSMEGSASRG